MDHIVQLPADRSRFLNLRSIVLAGHSGEGQFMQRYAAVNQMEQKLGVSIRYVVANPSSYLYFEGQLHQLHLGKTRRIRR